MVSSPITALQMNERNKRLFISTSRDSSLMFSFTKFLGFHYCLVILSGGLFVESQVIDISPRLHTTAVSRTRLYLINAKYTDIKDLSVTCSVIDHEAQQLQSRKKRSQEGNPTENDPKDVKCPLAPEQQKPVKSIIPDENKVRIITATPESIILSDDLVQASPPTDYHDRDYRDVIGDDQLQLRPRGRFKGSYRRNDTKKRKEFFDDHVPFAYDEDGVTAEAAKEQELATLIPESNSYWQLDKTVYNFKRGIHFFVLDLKYTKPVESSVKQTFSVMCVPTNVRSEVVTANIVADLKPFYNKTPADSSTKDREFVLPEFYDLAPCTCDVTMRGCDKNCCCDQDCPEAIVLNFGCQLTYNETLKLATRQPTGYECESNPVYSPFCIAINTLPYLNHFHPVEPALTTISAYKKRVPTAKITTDVTSDFRWETRHYKQGTPIQTELKNMWTMPLNHNAGQNCILGVISFQTDARSNCIRRVSHKECATFFNVDHYRLVSRKTEDSELSMFPSELYGSKLAPLRINFVCVDNITEYKTSGSWYETRRYCSNDSVETLLLNDAVCQNSVIEADYVFWWRGPTIARVDVTLVVADLQLNVQELLQRFSVKFRHSPVKKNINDIDADETPVKKTTIQFPVLQADFRGNCKKMPALVDLSESTVASCLLEPPENENQSCADYKRLLCEYFEPIVKYVDDLESVWDLFIARNDSLCNSSTEQFENDCVNFPTHLFIDVLYVDLGIRPNPSLWKILGIDLEFQSTHRIPLVGFSATVGSSQFLNTSRNSSRNGTASNGKIGLEFYQRRTQTYLFAHLHFQRVAQEEYDRKIISTSYNFLRDTMPIYLWKELFDPFAQSSSELLSYSVGVSLFVIFLTLTALLFYLRSMLTV